MTLEVSPQEVREKLEEEEDPQIVDIRPRAAFERGHIPGAINIPMNELPMQIDQYDWGDEIVVACPIGQSSIQAARLIKSYEGVTDEATVASMAGGYEEWDYELSTEDEAEA